jgi:hypothetical protein
MRRHHVTIRLSLVIAFGLQLFGCGKPMADGSSIPGAGGAGSAPAADSRTSDNAPTDDPLPLEIPLRHRYQGGGSLD